ncbi:MAG: sulfur carrier protein ThiS [Nitrosomonas sp.]|nr:MAG: sulfur carrier protein ThiS [Nitrosomonas sp.]HMV12758.1 sulfur carrier protein ThiS [Nitrosomonas sp.]HMW20371.1 sulfur carrier protein ThiS [Nitrosomonas sp.]HMW68971.1 sulfur carrier protein ThiS [Nitrosomonas sp.]HMY61931.1 sulfur carrier protein ThiS [Nitrosomonas sp.]
MIQLIINGEPQQFESSLNLQQLLENMGLQNKRIAIEHNGEIIPRSRFSDYIVTEGDRLEIVVAVGGG